MQVLDVAKSFWSARLKQLYQLVVQGCVVATDNIIYVFLSISEILVPVFSKLTGIIEWGSAFSF